LEPDIAAHKVMPDGEPLVGDIAPGLVEADMPVVDVPDIGRLETDPVEPEREHQRSAVQGDDVLGDVTGVGQGGPNARLLFQPSERDAALSHDAAPGPSGGAPAAGA